MNVKSRRIICLQEAMNYNVARILSKKYFIEIDKKNKAETIITTGTYVCILILLLFICFYRNISFFTNTIKKRKTYQ